MISCVEVRPFREDFRGIVYRILCIEEILYGEDPFGKDVLCVCVWKACLREDLCDGYPKCKRSYVMENLYRG